MEGTEKVAIYQKRLFSTLKTASFSLKYLGRDHNYSRTVDSQSLYFVFLKFLKY